MSTTFPRGPGVAQGGGAGQMVAHTIHEGLVVNEPEADGPSDYPRPQPTDPGGTNNAGWTKTAEYDDGYYGIDEGIWKQV